MFLKNIKNKIYFFIKRKILKIDDQYYLPKKYQWITMIFYPIQYFIINYYKINYDYCNDIYIFYGIKYSDAFFRALSNLPINSSFIIKKEDNYIFSLTKYPLE